jgi:ATP-binding cassette subfamily B protein
VRRRVSDVNSFLSERISGMKIIQIFAQENRTRKEFMEKNDGLLSANFSEMYVFAIFRPLISMFSTISLAVIIYFGAGLHQKGIISLGVLIAYLDLIGKFYRPLQQVSEQFTVMQSAMAGGERLFELLETEDRIPEFNKDPDNAPVFCGCKEVEDEDEDEDDNPAISFDNVKFSYKEGEPVLKGISFNARRGETLAIAGYTGSGKTTVANLAARFWDVDSGCITLGGVDIRKVPLKLLRKTVQTVQQDVFLFSGTIRENITLGRAFSEEELISAAEAACLMPILEKLEGGFEHKLSEGGTNLSGGQRQLIAFARVIAYDPPVLILDEATASIDTETEKLIQGGLQNLLKDRTAIVIAHRLSTIRDADRILVLSSGKIIESGSHEQLIEKQGLYYNLYSLQFNQT